MKLKQAILILACLILAIAPFAEGLSTAPTTAKTLTVAANTQTTTSSACRTTEELNSDITACKKSGMSYVVEVGSDGCKFVKCAALTTTSETPTMKKTSECPNSAELEKMIGACPNEYKKYTDTFGCTQIACPTTTSTDTADCPDIDSSITKCKEAGMDYDTYADNAGCKQVKCRERVEITSTGTGACKKYMNGNCIMIVCDDGWQFDSCTYCTTGATQATPTVTQASTKTATAAETKGINPQPEPPKESNDQMIASKVMNCIKDEIKNSAEIDDEITWAKCKKQHTITTEAGKILSDIQKCVTDLKGSSAEIDDEITWAKCKGKYISESVLATAKLSPQPDPPGTATGAGVSSGTDEVAINPQPEPPAPTFFGKIGGWFKNVFSK